MLILLTIISCLSQFALLSHGYGSRTRVSAVEIWRNDSEDGALHVAHGINSWPALLEQLSEPILERGAMIEGDVSLYQQRKHRNRAIPLMSAPLKVADRVTFKDWLREVAKLRKVIKINVRTTEAVRPVLQYLFAANEEITSPVILHANVFRSPRSVEAPIDAKEFIDDAKQYFPEATLSFGWTKNNVSELTIAQKQMGWKELFQLLELVKEVEQPVMINARLTSIVGWGEQLSFILGVRPTISAMVWSDQNDEVGDWSELIDLRSGPYGKRLVFDLLPHHRTILKMLPYSISLHTSNFDRNRWRLVEFPSSSSRISGAIESDEGVALIGRPTAFLISLLQPSSVPGLQRITAQLTVVRKRYVDDEGLHHTGLTVYLLEKVLDLQSPTINAGIKVFLGCSGRIFIENRGKLSKYYQAKSIGRVHATNCYNMEIIDRGWRVELIVSAHGCISDEFNNPTKISLDTPVTKTRQLRSVIVSKSGDDAVDFLVRNLKHSTASGPCWNFLVILIVSFIQVPSF